MSGTRVTVDMAEALREELVEAGVDAVLAAVHDAVPLRWLTRSRTTDTAIVQVPGRGSVVRKRWRWPGFGERLKGVGRTTALAPTPAEREWRALGRSYGSSGLRFHPRPLALRIEREGAFAARAMLLLEEIPDASDLAEYLAGEAHPSSRAAVLRDLASRVRVMHADGVADGDLHPRNLLVQSRDLRVWKVDCARQRVHRAPLTGRRAEYDLACIDVGLARFASRGERVRALRLYLGGRVGGDTVRALAERVDVMRRRIESIEGPRLPPRTARE